MSAQLQAAVPRALQRIAREFVRYTGVGALATACHYLVLIGSVELGDASPVVAAMAGFLVGGLVSYTLNRRWTFASDRAHEAAVPRFALVAFVGFLLTGLFMSAFTEWLAFHYLPAQILTSGLVLLWTFTAHRYWTFEAHCR